jgi:hypothetical protein
MDFKARFQGKTSKITKEGHIEGEAPDFDATPSSNLMRQDSNYKQDRTSVNGGSREQRLTHNSQFSNRQSD